MFKHLLLTTWIVLLLIGCQKEVEKAPTASFTIENNDCTATCEVIFTNTSEIATSYDWNFGDGTTSSERSPRHTYTKAGTYQVKLVAKGKGGSNTLSQTVTIKAPAVPAAAFTISNNGCTAPCTLNFTNQSTNATSYMWDLGDKTSSSEANPTQAYTQAGKYLVKLTATGPGGSASKTDTVTINAPAKVVAAFRITNGGCTIPCTVSFTNESTNATSYQWDFGDGTTSTEVSPTKSYTKAGSFTIKLTATGPGGSHSASQTVSTQAPAQPQALFSISNNGCSAPCTVSFTNQSTNATSYVWEFGEGTTSTKDSPSHNYTKAGNYSVKLTATGSGGTNSLAKAVTISVSESVHLRLGNPTNATSDIVLSDNYLMVKPQFALSYNRSKGHANWVAWELTKDWIGGSDRQDNFRPDPALPGGWYRVVTSDYTNSGFDRGHLCPSADRTRNDDDNASTFLMTNIIPQAPQLNRESWARLEDYCRGLAGKGYRLYIIAGVYGTGGEGSSGAKNSIKSNVNVPSRNYKLIVAIPNIGTVDQITATTPVIAVDMPNQVSLTDNKSWTSFITTPEAIEKAAGVTFFSNLPEQVRNQLRAVRHNPASSTLRLLFNEVERSLYF